METVLRFDNLSDEELAANAQAGSRHSYEELVRRYGTRLFHYLRARIPTDQDVEDLVQDTFLKAYNNIEKFNPEYKFSTWIYTVASRLAISYYRKNRHIESTDSFIDTSVARQEKMIKEEDSANIWNLAGELKQPQYQVLWLRYMEELTIKEISRVMQKTQIHIRVLLHRARLNLAKSVDPATTAAVNSVPVERKLTLLS